MVQTKQNSAVAIAELKTIVSKSEAIEKGLSSYFTGIPCKRGHVHSRNVKNGHCLMCRHAARRGEPSIIKPKGYWLIRENVEEEAKKYKTKSEMKSKNQPAFLGMSKLNLSDELFPLGQKSFKYWTVERCFEYALLYSNLRDFYLGEHRTAYNKLCKLGLIMDATGHMKLNRVNNNYWTFDRCIEEALKYKTRKEFQTLSNGAYDKCHKNKWLNDVCSHMVSGYKTSDCVYVWKVSGHENVYKIGLTKNTIVENRISFVEK